MRLLALMTMNSQLAAENEKLRVYIAVPDGRLFVANDTTGEIFWVAPLGR